MLSLKTCVSRFILTLALASPLALHAAPTVEMQTSMGAIVIELNNDKAPISVQNFVKHAQANAYNGTIFHRVIDGFMIQGGGFSKTMSERPAPTTIKNEANNGLKNERGTIAMARRSDPHSASAQFFINLKDNEFLNFTSEQDGRTWGYAVFGKVVHGMDVVDKIAKVPTGNKDMFQNVPTEAITITSVKVIKP